MTEPRTYTDWQGTTHQESSADVARRQADILRRQQEAAEMRLAAEHMAVRDDPFHQAAAAFLADEARLLDRHAEASRVHEDQRDTLEIPGMITTAPRHALLIARAWNTTTPAETAPGVPERPASPRGTYRSVAAALRETARPGQLLHVSTVMREHRVSRTTAERALTLLRDEGLIAPVKGVGWRWSGDDAALPALGERLPGDLAAVITADGLAVGDPYPSEAALCERLGVSRTSLRPALRQLETEGVLTAAMGKGRTVNRLPAPATDGAADGEANRA